MNTLSDNMQRLIPIINKCGNLLQRTNHISDHDIINMNMMINKCGECLLLLENSIKGQNDNMMNIEIKTNNNWIYKSNINRRGQ